MDNQVLETSHEETTSPQPPQPAQSPQVKRSACPTCHREMLSRFLNNEGGICKKCSNNKKKKPCSKCKKLYMPYTLAKYDGKCGSCYGSERLECSQCHMIINRSMINQGICIMCSTSNTYITCPQCGDSHLRSDYDINGCPKGQCSRCHQFFLRHMLTEGECSECRLFIRCPHCYRPHARSYYDINGCPNLSQSESIWNQALNIILLRSAIIENPHLPPPPQQEIPKLTSVKFERLKNIDECGICLSKYDDKDDLYVFSKCLHVFHTECCQKWVNENKSCPTCREKM